MVSVELVDLLLQPRHQRSQRLVVSTIGIETHLEHLVPQVELLLLEFAAFARESLRLVLLAREQSVTPGLSLGLPLPVRLQAFLHVRVSLLDRGDTMFKLLYIGVSLGNLVTHGALAAALRHLPLPP